MRGAPFSVAEIRAIGGKAPCFSGTTKMAGKYFGTDGIRGKANTFPMTAEVAMKVGMAAGLSFQRGTHRHRVVLGKDTRLSG